MDEQVLENQQTDQDDFDGIDDKEPKEQSPEEVYDVDDGQGEPETAEADDDEQKEKEKEEQVQEEQIEHDQKEQIPDELTQRAKDAGLSDDDIKDFSQSQLEKVVSLLPKKEEAADQKQDGEKSDRQSESATDDEFKIELDEQLYDPDICKAMKSAAEQINAIKAELKEVSAGYKQAETANAERQFESMINSLGDEFNETLGKGSIDDIGPDSSQFANRCKVMEEMNAIASGYQATGKKLPSPQKLFERAVNSVFGDSIKSNIRKSIASQLDRRSSQMLHRGTAKSKPNMSPTQRAEAAVKQKLRDFGVDEDDEDF